MSCECDIIFSNNTSLLCTPSVTKRDEAVDPAERAKANWLRLFNRVRLQLQEVSEPNMRKHCVAVEYTLALILLGSPLPAVGESAAQFSDHSRYCTMASSNKSGDVCAVSSDILS